MRLLVRTTLLLLLVSLALPLIAESPRSLYNKGKDAEARQDFMAAFENYRQAYEQKPKELKYRIAYQRTRFLASAAHVNKGQDLREKGNVEEALQEFVYAAKIDPSNAAASQEARKTQALIEGAAAGQPVAPKPISPITRRLEEAAGPTELAPVSPQPITLEISNDSKLVYETMGKLAGINVLFDPEYVSRRVTLKLNAVSLQESLDILAFHSNTFWRPVTPNTIFVAANTPAKRRDLEQNILKTFYLSNVNAASDLVEVVNVIRTMIAASDFKIMQVNSQNAIVVRGTPDQVALAEKLIGDVDKARPEVIVEVAVMQVRRDKLRDIGIRPPTSASSAISVGIQPTTTTTGTTTGTTTAATATNLTLNTLANLKDKDIVVNIPAATVNLLYNDNNSRLIQNPQIRALDGQKASLKIGDRIPIATGSFGSGFGAGGLGASGLVNTQFQYIDVGVNVDITPRVFMNREVGLKMVLEISSVTGSTNIGGITQPIISQRRVEHEIRLREGEVNLLGGIFEQQNTKSISGIPGLAQLPFLKYLFAEERNENVESEIVFILIPHIVRGQEYTELNNRAIDVGTNTSLDLRRVSRPTGVAPATAAPQSPVPMSNPVPNPNNAAPASVAPQSNNQAQPTQPNESGAAPPAAQNQSSTAPQEPVVPGTIFVDPAAASQAVGRTFNMNVMVRGAKDLYSAPLQISYDPNTLQLINISNGDLLSRDGQPVALVHREDLQSGTVQANATRPPNTSGISGDGVLYTLTFQAKFRGDSTLNIIRPSFRNSALQPIPMASSGASISIK
ncbi:MAG TPA: cohesin domain-containing protein [Terriglobales bacterium]|nr:cohesin domain-containing protein [Terriglobales bacterium]